MSIRLSWKVKRESGRPLAADDIDRYELVVTHDGNAVPATPPAPGATDYLFAATDPGVYGFGLVCVPKKGGKSDPATGSTALFDETRVVVFDFVIEVVAP